MSSVSFSSPSSLVRWPFRGQRIVLRRRPANLLARRLIHFLYIVVSSRDIQKMNTQETPTSHLLSASFSFSLSNFSIFTFFADSALHLHLNHSDSDSLTLNPLPDDVDSDSFNFRILDTVAGSGAGNKQGLLAASGCECAPVRI